MGWGTSWALLSIADHCLPLSRTCCPPIFRFFDDISCSRLGSTVATHTAFIPWFPIANFAVNWKCVRSFCRKSRHKATYEGTESELRPALGCLMIDLDTYLLGDNDIDDFFSFLTGLILPTQPTARRLTSVLAWFQRPLSSLPISVHVLASTLNWSTWRQKQDTI